MKKTSFPSFRIRLTTRFIIFYFSMMFIIIATIVFIYSYEGAKQEGRIQQEENQREVERLADNLDYILSTGNRLSLSLNMDEIFQQFLNDRFSTRQEELNAFTSHIRPMLNAMIISSSYIHGMYLYRDRQTFLGHDGILSLFADLSDIPYPFDSGTENKVLLINREENLYLPEGQDYPVLPCFVCLSNLYSLSQTRAAGVLEIQISMQDALSRMNENHDIIICANDNGYKVTWENETPVIAEIPEQDIIRLKEGLHVANPIGNTGLTILRELDSQTKVRGLLWVFIPLALFSIAASAFFCVIINRYARRITQLSDHIQQNRDMLPKQYHQKEIFKDEMDNLIQAYDEQVDTIYALIKKAAQAEHNQQEAQYYALNSQIKPHFLFNTLENIRMQIEIGEVKEAGNMLYALGHVLQYNMSMRSESTLYDELDHIHYYLKIYWLRLRTDLQYEVENRMEYEDILCPFCVLQPLIENCIRHGYQGKGNLLNIKVSVNMEGDSIEVVVKDNGKGIQPETIKQLNERLSNGEEPTNNVHIGLFNVNARIRYLFGNDCGIRLSSAENGGLICRMRFTKKKADNSNMIR